MAFLAAIRHYAPMVASPATAPRAALRAELDATVARLVARAAADGWPIRADHCFLRIAYDVAVGAKWNTVVARPAWASLSLEALRAAIVVLDTIERDGCPALHLLNDASLAFRRAAR